MTYIKKQNFIYLLILFFATLYPQKKGFGLDFNFTHIDSKDGLSNNIIYSIYQDKMGKMWIATDNGLNLYDGDHFEVFRHQYKDSTSICSGRVYDINSDSKGNILFSTEIGIDTYLPQKHSFKQISYSRIFKSYKIYKDPEQRIWFINNHHLSYSYDINNKIYQVKINCDTLIGSNLLEIKKDTFLCSYIYPHHGFVIAKLDSAKSTFKIIQNVGNKYTNREYDCVSYKKKNGDIWIGSPYGLFQLKISNKRQYYLDRVEGEKFANINVRNFYKYRGKIWIATNKGIYMYSEKDNSFDFLSSYKANPRTLSYSSSMCFYEDRNGTLWIGSYFGGINLYNPRNNMFQCISPTRAFNKVTKNAIRGMCNIPNNKIWIGIEGEGIMEYNTLNKEYQRVKGTENLSVHTLYTTSDSTTVWIGTLYKGAFKYNIKKHKLISIPIWKNKESDITDFQEDAEGNIYAFAFNESFVKLNSNGQILKKYRSKKGEGKYVNNTLFLENEKKLILGSGPGNYFVDTHNLEVAHNPYFSKELYFTSEDIYEDSSHDIWFCSYNGITKWDRKMNHFFQFTEKDGLPNDHVYNIIEDQQGKMWATTDNGLVTFSKNFADIKVFTTEDGLPINQFSRDSKVLCSNSRICLGTTDGVVFVDTKMNEKPTLQENFTCTLTDIIVNNNSLSKGYQKNTTFDKNHWSSVDLNWKDNNIEFRFSSFYYGAIKKAKYTYRLIGQSNEWTTTHEGKATFQNLPPGDYRFQVKACNPDGIWMWAPESYNFTILAPWYQQSWAISLFVFILLILLIGIIRFYGYKLKTNHALEVAQLEKEQTLLTHQERLKLFTNIAHEFRTPLTLVSGSVNLILKGENDPMKREYLNSAQRNCSILLRLINNLLDFRKLEYGEAQLRLAPTLIQNLLLTQVEAFRISAHQKDISLQLKCIREIQDQWTIDPNKIISVLYNLLSNAIKYTPEHGQITILWEIDSKHLSVKVHNQGEAIKIEDQKKLFDRFYQGENVAFGGSGIGLSLSKEIIKLHHGTISVESKPQKGTTFTFEIPKLKATEEHIDWNIETPIDNEKSAYKLSTQPWNLPQVESFKLLLVEDHDELIHFIKQQLSSLCEIRCARNGKEALKIINRFTPDAILSDLMMPEMDGSELCRELKRNINTQHIPFVLLTANDTYEAKHKCIASGVDAYFTKPFEFELLLGQISNLIQLRKAQKESILAKVQSFQSEHHLKEKDQEFFEKVTSILNRELSSSQLTAHTIAQEMGISYSTLNRKIKNIVDKGINDFIRSYRLEESKKMLSSEHTISEIAYSVGFNSPSYFSSCFKKTYGLLPTEYREKEIENS